MLQALMELQRTPATPGHPSTKQVWSVPPLRGDEVARPALAEALVTAVAVQDTDTDTVEVTAGLVGAGGFGKTTLARMLVHDARVRAQFDAGVVWVTLGKDTNGPELASKLVSAARLFDPAAAEVSDPLAAGSILARALSGRRVLLVVDDVWTPEQVEPFLIETSKGGDDLTESLLIEPRNPPRWPPSVGVVSVPMIIRRARIRSVWKAAAWVSWSGSTTLLVRWPSAVTETRPCRGSFGSPRVGAVGRIPCPRQDRGANLAAPPAHIADVECSA